MDISERLTRLRSAMKAHGIDMYYIPSDDFHGSEYVGEYFRCREYISGFTGSAGTVIVTAEQAGLWTDGRYFLQAEDELAGTGITLYKSGCEGVPTTSEHIRKELGEGILGFDGRVVSAEFAEDLIKKLGREHIRTDIDLFSEIWEDRPPLPSAEAFLLDERYAGESRAAKIERIRSAIKEKGADIILMTALDEICWTLNVRGGDVLYNPVVLSYLSVGADHVKWFVDRNKLSAGMTDALDGIEILPYDDFYRYVSEIGEDKTVFIGKARTNYGVAAALPEKVKTVSGDPPAMLFKAVKNDTEIKNMTEAHIMDGAAVTKFIYRIKKNPSAYTEMSAAALIAELRSRNEGYVSESFEPIIAYKEHGAIVHYSPSEKTDVRLAAEGFLLCDTGGHYLKGTTDITRTICLGKATDEMKRHYTAVLRGNLALAAAIFPHGCRGINLDVLARSPLWNEQLDYDHGTGHGVGYLLNVHEGPNSVRSRIGSTVSSAGCVLEPGMITSDEPGLYLEGRYGIRTENLILCKAVGESDFGKFLGFDTLTLVPYDPEAVDASLMTDDELRLYNGYQKRVYDTIAPLLDDDEREWLRIETRTLGR